MAKFDPDYSMQREGVPLSDWLWRLVDESEEIRRAAGEALQAMECGVPSVHTEWEDLTEFPDTESQRLRFEQAVRQAVVGPDFNTPEFVRKLGAYQLALTSDWSHRASETIERDAERNMQFTRLADRLIGTMDSAASEGERQHAHDRLMRLMGAYICGSCQVEDDPLAGAESVSSAGLSAHRLFDILDSELLAAPEVLERMLDSQLRYQALSALERIGPPAISFAPELIRQMDRDAEGENSHFGFDAAHALGSIGRGNAVIVEEMIARLRSDQARLRVAAAQVFEKMGTEVCGREQEIIDLLRPLLGWAEEVFAATFALASVGRHQPDARRQVLEMARPRPARWISSPDDPEQKYDQIMRERGMALSAMRFFTDYPGECLPVLLDAMETFEEFDPDETYGGPLGRISSVIATFGPQAAEAAGPLAAHLEDDLDEIPTNILDALAAIGPAARETLPQLHALRTRYAEMNEDEELADLDRVIVEKMDDPIGWTIQQICGQSDPN